MKTKFLLVLIALNGLLLGANSASAATVSQAKNSQNVASLSHTISKLIDLDANSHGLVESAINRALIAKNINTNEKNTPGYQQPIINGRIVKPIDKPIINGIIIRDRQPLENGIIIRNPRQIKQPLINGVIERPYQR
jgi:hypothetical protein